MSFQSVIPFFWGFPHEYVLACLAYLIPLNKKSGWVWRFLLIVAAQSASHIFLTLSLLKVSDKPGYENGRYFLMGVALFTSFFLGTLMFRACAKGTFWDALFGACCGYATQHLAYVLHDVAMKLFPSKALEYSALLVLLLTILCCYLLFGRRLPNAGEYRVRRQEALRSFVIVIPFAYLLSMLTAAFYDRGGNLALYLICRVYAIFCCVFALWLQTSMNEKVAMEVEYQTQQKLMRMQKEQYELSRENIDLINRKCHDLKYQVAALKQEHSERKRSESIEAIEKSVLIYDSIAATGNEVLDTILTERSLNCEKEHITWTCVADGSKLGHIDAIDLYVLFGNILDNAIESVRKLDDPAQRVVSMNVYTRSNMAVIQVENYFSGTIQMQNGVPVTTKEDAGYHGFGMHSIKKIVEKYGGKISVDVDGQIFLLSILMPLGETLEKSA